MFSFFLTLTQKPTEHHSSLSLCVNQGIKLVCTSVITAHSRVTAEELQKVQLNICEFYWLNQVMMMKCCCCCSGFIKWMTLSDIFVLKYGKQTSGTCFIFSKILMEEMQREQRLDRKWHHFGVFTLLQLQIKNTVRANSIYKSEIATYSNYRNTT